MNELVGSVEAGGTKFVCAVGTGERDLREVIRFPTADPGSTITRVIDFFRDMEARHGELKAFGVGSFGPIDLRPDSPTFGHVTSTPKPGWSGADMVGPISGAFGVPVAFDTDVNAASLGEWRWGAAVGLDTFIYLTVGTGVGGGGLVGGELLHGLVHPEMGHMMIPRDPLRDPYEGNCPYHGDCLEGLAAGSAVGDRWGRPAETLPPDHPAWELEAEYLAIGLSNLVCVVSPQRFILGGGVMNQAQLFPMIRRKLARRINDYVRSPEISEDMEEYVVPPALGDRAGILGGIALAQRLLDEPTRGCCQGVR